MITKEDEVIDTLFNTPEEYNQGFLRATNEISYWTSLPKKRVKSNDTSKKGKRLATKDLIIKDCTNCRKLTKNCQYTCKNQVSFQHNLEDGFYINEYRKIFSSSVTNTENNEFLYPSYYDAIINELDVLNRGKLIISNPDTDEDETETSRHLPDIHSPRSSPSHHYKSNSSYTTTVEKQTHNNTTNNTLVVARCTATDTNRMTCSLPRKKVSKAMRTSKRIQQHQQQNHKPILQLPDISSSSCMVIGLKAPIG